MVAMGPIIIFEDDRDDIEVLKEVFKRLGVKRKLLFFDDAEALLSNLRMSPEPPFLILSDINVPGINGLELRKQIQEDEELREKSIPFVFLSTAATRKTVGRAYELTVQGYFKKQDNIEDIERQVRLILEYWTACEHPQKA